MNINYEYYKTTRSICPKCKKILAAKIVFYNDSVYMLKTCTRHGEFFTLIYRDKQKYVDSLKISKPALYPIKVFNNDFEGCGLSCGLCSEHQQHTCLPIIEITDYCNMSCPICLASNHNSYHMSLKKFGKIINNLLKAEGYLDFISISGGEPTLHPELLNIIDAARKQEIININLSTNGRIFLKDRDLLLKLIDRNVYISLQFDGFDEKANVKLRGQEVIEEKLRILELLEKHCARTALVMTVINGVNRKEIWKVVNYFLKKDFIKSITLQPIVFANPGFKYDGSKVITIPDIVREIASNSKGMISESDIINLPCSHPSCVALTYLLKLGNGKYIPIPRIVAIDTYIDVIKNRVIPGSETESYKKIKENIYNLWASSGIWPESKNILRAIKNIMREMMKCGQNPNLLKLSKIAEKNVKSLFIHHFMDAYNLDFSRIMKCCTQYTVDEDRLVPCCIFNNMERKR